MRKHHAIILFLFLLQWVSGYSQSRLEMTNAYIQDPNSLRIGDSLTFEFTLKNTGTTKYTGSINTFLYTNLDTNALQWNKPLAIVDTGVSDTLQLRARFPVQQPHFQPGTKSIIVIWPTGTGTTIKMDTFVSEEVIIKHPLTITEQSNKLNHVRFYPNPTKGVLRMEMLNTYTEIKRISIYDLQGRMRDFNPSGFNESSIDLEKYTPGVYFLELEFTDKQTARYRIVKTN